MNFYIPNETLREMSEIIISDLEKKYKQFIREKSITVSHYPVIKDNMFVTDITVPVTYRLENYDLPPVVFEPSELAGQKYILYLYKSSIDLKFRSNSGILHKSIIYSIWTNDILDQYFIWVLNGLDSLGPKIAEVIVSSDINMTDIVLENGMLTVTIAITVSISFRKTKVILMAKDPQKQINDPENKLIIGIS